MARDSSDGIKGGSDPPKLDAVIPCAICAYNIASALLKSDRNLFDAVFNADSSADCLSVINVVRGVAATLSTPPESMDAIRERASLLQSRG